MQITEFDYVIVGAGMTTLIGGRTNAPSIMIGEKCADLIRTGH